MEGDRDRRRVVGTRMPSQRARPTDQTRDGAAIHASVQALRERRITSDGEIIIKRRPADATAGHRFFFGPFRSWCVLLLVLKAHAHKLESQSQPHSGHSSIIVHFHATNGVFSWQLSKSTQGSEIVEIHGDRVGHQHSKSNLCRRIRKFSFGDSANRLDREIEVDRRFSRSLERASLSITRAIQSTSRALRAVKLNFARVASCHAVRL